ncbi:MAG: hypothetical protein QHH74_15930, partial [Spirochaetota bacterium]|nr:hypothetical protein [Spirochaetota bacterium]
MRYVKIKARTYNEAMMKLKMEHGDDAIPISHKNVKEGGLFNTGLFARDFVELTAAIPDVKPAKLKPKKNIDLTVGTNDNVNELLKQVIEKPETEPHKKTHTGLEQLLTQSILQSRTQQEEVKPVVKTVEEQKVETTDSSYIKLEKEFNELKALLKNLVETKQERLSSDICLDNGDTYFKP